MFVTVAQLWGRLSSLPHRETAWKGCSTGWLALVVLLAGCSGGAATSRDTASSPTQATAPNQAAARPGLNVLAIETFLADIAQNVAGDRLLLSALLPTGVDPHGFEPTPGDLTRVAASHVLIVNGAGFEEFLGKLLQNAGGERLVIEASAGLTSHTARAGDPHFWLDPNNVVRYVENIRDGLSQADPDGAATYAANAEVYIAQLKELDRWIAGQVRQVPAERRQLVTNHESFGYFADRYGFKIIGTIVPSVSTSASPSAQQLARLIDQIKATGAQAIFLETGTNPQLAQQVARETGIQVVTGLYSHSTTEAGGPAPTYIDMMKYNTRVIVDALK
jgi:ABC-type Zn uptake system ZnuABC Zn-binding protein ZnuA